MTSNITIELKLSTPASIGWYNPNIQDPLGLRPAEIKGLWRWWCRTCIAGAMYELGLLKGLSTSDIFLKPSKEEVKAISCFVGKILGLGYAGEKDSEASRFKIYIEAKEDIKSNIIELATLRNLQRAVLLTLDKRGRQQVRGINKGFKFTLVVSKRISKPKYLEAEELAIKILYLALQFSGVGKGARRGMGSLDITSIKVDGREQSIPRNISELLDEVYNKCRKIVEEYCSECIDSSKTRHQVKNHSIPPIPVLSKSKYQNIYLTQVYIVRGVNFEDVHNFFARPTRCRVLYKTPICKDYLRNKHYAWVLGLPRTQHETGYFIGNKGKIRSEVSRRPSPIMVSYHSNENIFGDGVFITTFFSGDWPTHMEWRSPSQKPRETREKSVSINVNPQTLLDAYVTAINELSNYLNKVRARIVASWP